MKLPSHIIKSLIDGKTSLGKHPSYPPDEENSFIIDTLNDYYEKITSSVKETDINNIKTQLSELLTKAKKIEEKNRDTLEELCAKTVNRLFNIPDDTLKIEMHLVNSVDSKDERLIPEKTVDYTFDDINDMNALTDEVYKRRMLDCLVAGASLYYSERLSNYLQDLFDIDAELPSLYKRIFELNKILLYTEKDTFDKDKMTDGGKVDVNLSSSDNIVSIKSQGILMPILLEETIKGILELAISHGLPKNSAKAQYIISKSDFKLAEMWDMRIGLPLWEHILGCLKKQQIDINEIGSNYLLLVIAQMPVKIFNSFLQEVFKNTRRGQNLLSDIGKNILYVKEKEDFDSYMNGKRNDVEINDADEFYDADELITDSLSINEAGGKQPLISPEDAEKQGFAIPKEHLSWKPNEFKVPNKRAVGYKVFALINGELYPPVVANDGGLPTPMKKWLPCSCPPIVGYTASEHRPQVKTGGKGTARNLGNLSFRPGWHLGMIPFAKQFCKKLNNKESLMIDGRYVFPDDLVFARCYYQADNDLSDESYKNGLTKNGKYQHSRAGIPRIPKNAFYRYRTNVDPTTEDWIITGAVFVDKILSRDEVDALNAQHGIKPLIYANEKQTLALKRQVKAQQAKEQVNADTESSSESTNVVQKENEPNEQLLPFEEGKVYSSSAILEEIVNAWSRKNTNHNVFKHNSDNGCMTSKGDDFKTKRTNMDRNNVTKKYKVESKKHKKVIRNDKGEKVPENCPDCGSKIGIYISGEPIYRCSNPKCQKNFGVVPFRLKN